MQAGLRIEHTALQTHQLVSDARGTRNYTYLFPSLHISRKFDTDNEVQLSYSRRINRPNFWQLNPFADYSDPVNLRSGNPNLQPELIDAVEGTYTRYIDRQTLTLTAYFRQTNILTFLFVRSPN